MKERFEEQIKKSLEADFKKMAELIPGEKGTPLYRMTVMPYVSGTVNRITDEITVHSKELNMPRHEILNWVNELHRPIKLKYLKY